MAFDYDPQPTMKRRIGKSAAETGNSNGRLDCPDLWELEDGNYAIVGDDITDRMNGRLPDGVVIGATERMVVIPRNMLIAAKGDIPSA